MSLRAGFIFKCKWGSYLEILKICRVFSPFVCNLHLISQSTFHTFGKRGQNGGGAKHRVWPLAWEGFLCPSSCHKRHMLPFIARMKSPVSPLNFGAYLALCLLRIPATPDGLDKRCSRTLFTEECFSRTFTFREKKIESVSLKLCHTASLCGKKKKDWSEIQRAGLGQGMKISARCLKFEADGGVCLLPLVAREDYLQSSDYTFGERGERRWKHGLGPG